jgi:transcription elongation factor Elf1
MLEKYQLAILLDDALRQQSRKRKGGNELVYFCPKCHHPKRKLEVCIDESNKFFGVFHCWTCGVSGNLYKLIEFSISPSSYKSRLFDILKDVKLTWGSGKSTTESDDIVLPKEFHPLFIPRKSPEYKNALAYLKRRGCSREDILRYNLGYCECGDYEHHIIIPSYDVNGVLNFFIGRRYYNTDGVIPFKKPNASLNIVGFECFVNWAEPPILVEGAFNAITIRRNAIPLFGKFPSSKLYETMLANHVERVYVCLDTDAEPNAISICERLLRLGIVPYMVKLIGGKDANEIGFHNSWECIRSAVEIDSTFLLAKQLEM